MPNDDFGYAFSAPPNAPTPFDTPPNSSPSSFTSEERSAFAQFFQIADVERRGAISGQTAVLFFSKSKLPVAVLSDIWRMADSTQKGYLEQPAFEKALKLIALAQNGKISTVANLSESCPLPFFEGVTFASRRISATPSVQGEGVEISADDRVRWMTLWTACGPANGFLTGDKTRPLFMQSGLPVESLSRIWSLVDTGNFGKINLSQFLVAMHFMTSLRAGKFTALPNSVSQNLLNSLTQPAPPVPPRKEPLSPISQRKLTLPGGRALQSDWTLSDEDKRTYEGYFDSLNSHGKGFLTGEDVSPFFIKSKLAQPALAQVWELSDVNKAGRLNKNEFIVSMQLIKVRMAGNSLPAQLPEELILRARGSEPGYDESSTQSLNQGFQDLSFDTSQVTPDTSGSDDIFSDAAAFGTSNMTALTDTDTSVSSGMSAIPAPSRMSSSATFTTNLGASVFQPNAASPASLAATSSFGNSKASQPASVSKPSVPLRGSIVPNSHIAPPTSAPAPANENMWGTEEPARNIKWTTQPNPTLASSVSIPKKAPEAGLLEIVSPAFSDISRTSTQMTSVASPFMMPAVLKSPAINDSELGVARSEVNTIQTQLSNITKENFSLKEQRSKMEVELKALNDQKNELSLKASQTNATIDHERKLLQLSEDNVIVERQRVQAAFDELTRLENHYIELNASKAHITQEIEEDKERISVMKIRVKEVGEDCQVLKKDIERLKKEKKNQRGMLDINSSMVASAERELERLKLERDKSGKNEIGLAAPSSSSTSVKDNSDSFSIRSNATAALSVRPMSFQEDASERQPPSKAYDALSVSSATGTMRPSSVFSKSDAGSIFDDPFKSGLPQQQAQQSPKRDIDPFTEMPRAGSPTKDLIMPPFQTSQRVEVDPFASPVVSETQQNRGFPSTEPTLVGDRPFVSPKSPPSPEYDHFTSMPPQEPPIDVGADFSAAFNDAFPETPFPEPVFETILDDAFAVGGDEHGFGEDVSPKAVKDVSDTQSVTSNMSRSKSIVRKNTIDFDSEFKNAFGGSKARPQSDDAVSVTAAPTLNSPDKAFEMKEDDFNFETAFNEFEAKVKSDPPPASLGDPFLSATKAQPGQRGFDVDFSNAFDVPSTGDFTPPPAYPVDFGEAFGEATGGATAALSDEGDPFSFDDAFGTKPMSFVSPSPIPLDPPNEGQALIMTLGFSKKEVDTALAMYDNNTERAIDYLLSTRNQ